MSSAVWRYRALLFLVLLFDNRNKGFEGSLYLEVVFVKRGL